MPSADNRFTRSGLTLGEPETWTPRHPCNGAREAATWLAEARPEVERAVQSCGGVLFRGLDSICDASDFELAAIQLTPTLRDYVGGTSPRTTVQGRIMTATHVPEAWSIPLHQEMAYTRNPPAWITFFCEKAATLGGGDSTVGDMRHALRSISPDVRNRFEKHGLQLRRTLPAPDAMHMKAGVKKPWPEVFGTESTTEVEHIVASNGWRSEWHHGVNLVLWQDLLPPIRTHPGTGETVWCNQAHFFNPACMIEWALEDGRYEEARAIAEAREKNPDIVDNIIFGTGEPVPDSDALHVYRVLRRIERQIHLRQNDILLLDNLLLAHGRRAYAGTRSVLVAIAD